MMFIINMENMRKSQENKTEETRWLMNVDNHVPALKKNAYDFPSILRDVRSPEGYPLAAPQHRALQLLQARQARQQHGQ